MFIVHDIYGYNINNCTLPVLREYDVRIRNLEKLKIVQESF